MVPYGDGAVRLCWLCAHMVAEHGADLDQPYEQWPDVSCRDHGCKREDIFPLDVDGSRWERNTRRTPAEEAAKRAREGLDEVERDARVAYLDRLAKGAEAIARHGDGTGTRRGVRRRPAA